MRQRGTGRDHAQCQLTLVDFLAQHIPALVKRTFEAITPFRRDMMGRMHGRRREVTEEGFVGCRHLLPRDPFNRFLCQIFRQMIIVTAKMRLDWRRLVIDRRLPVRGLSADDAIETFEPHAGRPAIERARRVLFP